MTPTRDVLDRIAVALERIADNMDAERILAKRREANRNHMREVRGKSVYTQAQAERKQEGKEGKSPHTPLKGEIQEKKKDAPQRVRAREDGFDGLFERFWTAYPGPRKTDRRKCREKFAAILRESGEPDAMLQRMLDGIDRWRKSALEHVRRRLPHALETFKLIIRNVDNRKESICSLVKSQLSSRKNGNSRGRSTTATSATSPGSSPASR